MIVGRGYGKNGSARGGVLAVFGYGRVNLFTLLRMRYTTRENRRRVDARVEGRVV
jgi:type II secretory pathway predicted ATPase ExeA